MSSKSAQYPTSKAGKAASPSKGQAANRSKAAGSSLLERKFSFADTSLKEVQSAVASLSKDIPFYVPLWQALLYGSPAKEFKCLQNRSLAFWTTCFNRWQELQDEDGMAPERICCMQLQRILGLSKHNLHTVVQLFNPDGANRLKAEGMSNRAMSSAFVNILDILLPGILLSPFISRKHKLKFTFGLFDFNDTGTLDINEYFSYRRALFRGFCVVFKTTPPPDEMIASFVEYSYKHISAIAARRVKQMAGQSSFYREQVVQVIKARQLQATRELKKSRTRGVAAGQLIPYDTLEDFLVGDLSQEDPLAIPMRLFILRFCQVTDNVLADEFDEGISSFNLCHTSAVPVPNDDPAVTPQQLLSRPEVLLVREVFQKFSQSYRSFWADSDEIQSIMEASLVRSDTRAQIREKIITAFRGFAQGKVALRSRDGFFTLLRSICPKAQSKHLCMFESWCEQYDALVQATESTPDLNAILKVYEENDQRPVLSNNEIQELKNRYARLVHKERTQGDGCVDLKDVLDDLRSYLGVKDVRDIYPELDEDGCVDLNDYLRIMCPPGYRLPEMGGFGRDLFGRLLAHQKDLIGESEQKLNKLFRSKSNGSGKEIIDFKGLLPEIDTQTWDQWCSVFHNFDKDKDGTVDSKELLASGKISADVARYVVGLIDPDSPTCFTLEGFMCAMLQAYGMRPSCQTH